MKKIRLSAILLGIISLCMTASCNLGGLNPKQKKATEDAVAELRKLSAATKVGVNKIDYSRNLASTQAAVTQAIDLLSTGELKDELTVAMEGYVDANELWNIMGGDDIIFACKIQPTDAKSDSEQRLNDLACNPKGGELLRKYNIPLRTRDGGVEPKSGMIMKKEGLSIIWQTAGDHAKKASDIVNR